MYDNYIIIINLDPIIFNGFTLMLRMCVLRDTLHGIKLEMMTQMSNVL